MNPCRTPLQASVENSTFFTEAVAPIMRDGRLGQFILDAMRLQALEDARRNGCPQQRLHTRGNFEAVLLIDASKLCLDGSFVTNLEKSIMDAAEKIPSAISGHLNSRVMLNVGPDDLEIVFQVTNYWGANPDRLVQDPTVVPMSNLPLGRLVEVKVSSRISVME